MKQTIKQIAVFFESLFPETIEHSKEKWDRLARKNARYIVWTTKGKEVTDQELDASGKADYETYIATDPLLIKGSSFLEIGCGIGRMTKEIAKHFETYATDISKELIKKAREQLSHPQVHFYATDGITLPLPSKSVDCVFSYHVFQHMPSEKVVLQNLKEIRRVMNPEGVAKIQFRGVSIRRWKWSYGIHLDTKRLLPLIQEAKLHTIKTEGEHTKDFWVWMTY